MAPAVRRLRPNRSASCARALSAALRAEHERLTAQAWPNKRWSDDPVGFVREVLHEEPLPHQVKILEAARISPKVAVRSGQKTGKTKLVIWLALWFYSTRENAVVVMTANTKDQIERVLWRELGLTLRHARRHGFEIEAPPSNPASGMKSEDGRVIYGITVRDVEAMAGISGGNMLVIVDEASALSQKMAEAIEGNTAAGASMVWISNPTRTEGPFYDAFHTKREFWVCFHLSSEDVARWCAAEGVRIPGVATLETIERWELEFRRDSPFFKVRVEGEFLRNETGRVVTLDEISRAVERYVETRAEGRLSIGIDPSGPGDGGDEYAFCVVRGSKVLRLDTFPGLTEDDALGHVRALVREYRDGSETPDVIVDSEGPIGSALYRRLRGISETLRRSAVDLAFEVWGVKASHYARREPAIYARVRDELWAALAKWLKEGGAIPADHKLETELHLPSWSSQTDGKLRVTAKDEFRDRLGRSPDRADALCAAVWPPAPWLREADPPAGKPQTESAGERMYADAVPLDPWGGGGIDPYRRGRAA